MFRRIHLVDVVMGGRGDAGRGDQQCGAVLQQPPALRAALPKGVRPQQFGAIVVMQRARQQLAGAGCAMVDQHHLQPESERPGSAQCSVWLHYG